MNLQKRIDILVQLGNYLAENIAEWQAVKSRASAANGWFTEVFIDEATNRIVSAYLQKEKLENWARHYHLDDNIVPRNTGLVMAGNIPLVGFHDFLCVFISGHRQTIKPSSKDDILLRHLVDKMTEWEASTTRHISFSEMLKGCDAYIATGSNNSARYFEHYFSRYPNIIRRNRTSVAILDGSETADELNNLSDDIHLYFGLGCRNVTKIFVPREYDFIPLLNSFNRYAYFADHYKYKNNYDYQLSIALLNNIKYMTNGSTLLIENEGLFSAISQLHYGFYTDTTGLLNSLRADDSVQCILGKGGLPFGSAQAPGLMDYADGVDTMQFLLTI
ncbi:MAG: acyl-CoA reductase [Chitinophagaceae bacterium]|nr:acyl-CoA reductase [Chitinophagaceae bacterium]